MEKMQHQEYVLASHKHQGVGGGGGGGYDNYLFTIKTSVNPDLPLARVSDVTSP